MATPISLALLLWLLAVLLPRIGRAETRSARAGRAPTVRGSRDLDPGGEVDGVLALAREGKHAQEQHAQAVLWWI